MNIAERQFPETNLAKDELQVLMGSWAFTASHIIWYGVQAKDQSSADQG